jgi:hypothetical protein
MNPQQARRKTASDSGVYAPSLTWVFPVPHSAQRRILRRQTLYPIELRARESSSIAGVSGDDQPIQSMLGHIRRSIRGAD